MLDQHSLSSSCLDYSNYNKVIFKRVDKLYSCIQDIECHFEITNKVCPATDDYVAIVPATDLNNCIVSKNISDTVAKSQTTVFKAEDICQDRNDYCQFIYANKSGAVLGASTAFLLQAPNDDFTSIDEEYLVISPSTDPHFVPFDVYQQLVVKSRKLQVENKSISRQLREKEDHITRMNEKWKQELENEKEELFIKLRQQKQSFEIQQDNSKNEIQKLTKEKKEISSALDIAKCDATKAKNIQHSLEQELSIVKSRNEKLQYLKDNKFNVNELLEQLDEYEEMVKALTWSKQMCLKEFNIQKVVKEELEKLVNKLKRENEVLACKVKKYEGSSSGHT